MKTQMKSNIEYLLLQFSFGVVNAHTCRVSMKETETEKIVWKFELRRITVFHHECDWQWRTHPVVTVVGLV